jgi:hypothetical protein
MLFRLVNSNYDRHTERAYVEFRAKDDDGQRQASPERLPGKPARYASIIEGFATITLILSLG